MGSRRDPFGAELKRFARNIDVNQFKPLSPGVGFGGARRIDPKPERYDAPVVVARPNDSSLEQTFDRGQEFRPFDFASVDLPQPKASASFRNQEQIEQDIVRNNHSTERSFFVVRIIRFMLSHFVDLLAIVGALISALVMASLVFVPNVDQDFANAFFRWAPVKFILELSIISFAAVIYVLYGFYWGVFRLFVGKTLGQSMLRRSKSASQ